MVSTELSQNMVTFVQFDCSVWGTQVEGPKDAPGYLYQCPKQECQQTFVIQ